MENTIMAKKPASSNGKASAPKGKSTSLQDFFVDELKDIYWAEKHLVKVLPKMHKAATTDDLKKAISEHLSQTETHVSRLENVFELMGQKASLKNVKLWKA